MQTVSLPVDRAVEGSLPLYGTLTLLTAERHGEVALAPERAFGFAAAHPVVPLTIDEFERAALDYPIVFFGGRRQAFAVTGITPARNDFIDAGGGYCGGAYVPAYLRRHPFTLVDDAEGASRLLAVDETAAALRVRGDDSALPLFDADGPTETTRAVMTLCENYAAAERRTETVVRLLDELDLFEARQAHHRPRLADGGLGAPQLLLDHAVIDRARFDALDDAAIARLRTAGALGPVYAHLMSAANWERLALIGAP